MLAHGTECRMSAPPTLAGRAPRLWAFQPMGILRQSAILLGAWLPSLRWCLPPLVARPRQFGFALRATGIPQLAEVAATPRYRDALLTIRETAARCHPNESHPW